LIPSCRFTAIFLVVLSPFFPPSIYPFFLYGMDPLFFPSTAYRGLFVKIPASILPVCFFPHCSDSSFAHPNTSGALFFCSFFFPRRTHLKWFSIHPRQARFLSMVFKTPLFFPSRAIACSLPLNILIVRFPLVFVDFFVCRQLISRWHSSSMLSCIFGS